MTEPVTGPLAGIRIVEFDAIGPLPLAAMLLADMGADIIRITRPRTGAEAWDDVGGSILHRGRTAIELDLKTQTDAALGLIAKADALIEGYRPGVLERLGLGPDICLNVNPRLVYGRVTGWGQTGPLAMRAGHDLNYIALTGVLGAMGPEDLPPPVPLNLIGDYGGGTMFLIAGVLAALLCAKATGSGQVVDAAMTDGVASSSAMYHAFRASGGWSDVRNDNLLDGAAPFYRCYRCQDGKYVAVGALEPQFFRQLLEGLELASDAFIQNDRNQWPEMQQCFAEIFGQKPRDSWSARFAGTDACVTPVLGWDEAPLHPHNAARQTFDTRGGLIQPAPAPRFSATQTSISDARTATYVDVAKRWAISS